MNKYLSAIYDTLVTRNPGEIEYHQSVLNFLNSIDEHLDLFPDLERLSIIERLIEPDRVISFKVPWISDSNEIKINRGYRIQFNNLLGPYKGGLRFSTTVNPSVTKFLGFEQTLKNSLTGLPLGGAKGGADFNPIGKSDFEIMRFCQSYITELYHYIGNDLDIPAGDYGVGFKEIGYMYGMYKKLTHRHNGTFTSKEIFFGGSIGRSEATGNGLCYIGEKALNTYLDTSFKDKKVVISGTGNVGLNAALKARSFGAKIIAVSNIDGVIHDERGIDLSLITSIATEKTHIKSYLKTHSDAKYHQNPKEIWKIKADIFMPCAKENEVDLTDVKHLLSNGLIALFEGANMPLTSAAKKLLIENNIVYVPSKAANTGGVIVSGFEMSQNASHSVWSYDDVNSKLKTSMENIFTNIYSFAINLNEPYNLDKAANLIAFSKLYDAMKAQGI